jgi:hypothetical protein
VGIQLKGLRRAKVREGMDTYAGHASGADHNACVQGAELLGQVGKAAAAAAAAAATRATKCRAQVLPDCTSCLQGPAHEVLWVPSYVSLAVLNGHRLQGSKVQGFWHAEQHPATPAPSTARDRLAACYMICTTTDPLNVAISHEALQREVLHQAAAH